MKKKLAPADYVFSIEVMDGQTGLYNIHGVVADESIVEHYLNNVESFNVVRVQVFTLGLLEGPIQTISTIEEFMEFQQ